MQDAGGRKVKSSNDLSPEAARHCKDAIAKYYPLCPPGTEFAGYYAITKSKIREIREWAWDPATEMAFQHAYIMVNRGAATEAISKQRLVRHINQ